VLALNKWDRLAQAPGSAGRAGFESRTDLEDAKARTARKLRQRPQVLAVSAKTGRGLKRLVAEALRVADNSQQRIPTSELNRFLGDLQATREPPSVRGKRLRMYYMTQFETGPPRFAVQVNDRARVTRDYAYFLENRLRDRYGLQGVPLVIDFKTSSGRS
jgi:GTPase